ncbi:TetR/AcrR family transcriptional regulator [Actinomadura sp. 3N407]|uniref:TetR/AcrR family transcriptional regulator n=1 Tax=Actinomadura sp. 3N407 TaxID=3457423 RepID=UPI003FCCCB68
MSDPRSPEPKGAGGRPRDRHIDEAVIAAALAIQNEEGYAGVSLEAVARRAGTSRPAIYRRWPGRAPLVLAAVADRLDVPTPPDTGCTLCDLAEGLNVFLAVYRTIRPDVLSVLYAECAPDPDLRRLYLRTIVEPARDAVGRTLDRAIARGDLRSEIDRDLLLDIVGSLVQYRAMFGREHLKDDEAERAIEVLLRGAAVDYPALLAHSEALEREHLDRPGVRHVHSPRAGS